MKKLLFILTIAFLVSCKKDKTTQTTINCKLAKTIHIITGGASDTSIFTYTGDNISYTTHYSNASVIYNYRYTKSGNQYLVEYLRDGVKSHEGFATLNAKGFVDTSRITHLPTSTFNNRDRFYYDVNGFVTRGITNYNTYENDIKYHYINGNYSYWIYDVYKVIPANNTKDSIVFDYYLDKPKLTEKFIFQSKYGNLEKNLVKKRSYYDLLNGGALKRTFEYEYLTDAKGLVTREIWTIKTQPGNVISRIDTTFYQYICL